jgi:hypothetical protein
LVKPEISPEPSGDEREALDEALAHLLAEREEPRSDWWRAGVREALNPEDEGA